MVVLDKLFLLFPAYPFPIGSMMVYQTGPSIFYQKDIIWLVVWNIFYFSIQLEMSSSQLT